MKSKYLKTISLLHTAYNVFKGEVSFGDFTFYNLFLIFLKKNNLITIVDNRIEYDKELVETYLPGKIFKKFDEINFKKKNSYLSKELVDAYSVVLIIDEEVLNYYYKELTDLCISLMLKRDEAHSYNDFQPKELTELMNYFLPKEKKINVYNPFAGICSLGVNLSEETEYLAEEFNYGLAMLAELRFLILNKKNFQIKNTDSIKSLNEPFNDKYDFIVSTPPFGLKGKDVLERVVMESNSRKISFNSFIIEASLSKLKENGKLVLTIPESILYSGSKGNEELRRNLVVNSQIETLIKLPSRLFKSTGISSYIIVLGKDRVINSSIRMIDASEMVLDVKSKQNILDIEKIFKALNSSSSNENCVFVNKEEIINNDYNLSVNRYLVEDLDLTDIEVSNLERLSNLVTIVKREKVCEQKGKLIGISDLSKDKLDYTKTFEDLEERDLKNNPNLLKQDSLLLSSIQPDLQPTTFIKTESKVYYPPTFIMACIVDTSRVSLDYLVLELHKEYVVNQIKAKRIGTVVQRISRKDLLEIKIVLPNVQEQLKKVHRFKELIIAKKQQDFNKLVKDYGIDVADENSFLRHQIAGTLKNARGSFKAIKQIINEQIVRDLPGVLKLKRNPKFNKTLLDYLNILERDINSINKTVSLVGEELDLTQVKVSRFNIVDFLTNYVEEVKNRDSNLFELFLNIDEACFLEESQFKGITISGDKELLRRIFDNIIKNAVNHGFNNTISPFNVIEVNVLCDFKNLKLQVDFGNTGKPFPEDYSQEAFIRKGSKAGVNSGDGVGGWFINEVMKLHNGTLGFSDEKVTELVGREIVTTIELKFPIGLSL
jgi:type I restriction enzyme M protein